MNQELRVLHGVVVGDGVPSRRSQPIPPGPNLVGQDEGGGGCRDQQEEQPKGCNINREGSADVCVVVEVQLVIQGVVLISGRDSADVECDSSG